MQASQPATSPDEVMEVSGKAGQAITMPFADGPPTGYSWQLTLPEGVRRIGDAPGNGEATEYRLGSSATGALQVMASVGEYTLHARLARPWATDHPVRTITIHLHVS